MEKSSRKILAPIHCMTLSRSLTTCLRFQPIQYGMMNGNSLSYMVSEENLGINYAMHKKNIISLPRRTKRPSAETKKKIQAEENIPDASLSDGASSCDAFLCASYDSISRRLLILIASHLQ